MFICTLVFANTCEECDTTFWPKEGENGRICQSCVRRHNGEAALKFLDKILSPNSSNSTSSSQRDDPPDVWPSNISNNRIGLEIAQKAWHFYEKNKKMTNSRCRRSMTDICRIVDDDDDEQQIGWCVYILDWAINGYIIELSNDLEITRWQEVKDGRSLGVHEINRNF